MHKELNSIEQKLQPIQSAVEELLGLAQTFPKESGLSIAEVLRAQQVLVDYLEKMHDRERLSAVHSDPERIFLALFAIMKFPDEPKKMLKGMQVVFEKTQPRSHPEYEKEIALTTRMIHIGLGDPEMKEELSALIEKHKVGKACFLAKTLGDFLDLFRAACEAEGKNWKEQTIPKGFVTPGFDIFFTYENANTSTVIHETLHLDNKGLALDEYGEALDEGMTEHLTLEQTIGPIRRMLPLTFLTPYANEVQMVRTFLQNPAVEPLLRSRYSGENSQAGELFLAMMKTYGWESCYNFWRATHYKNRYDAPNSPLTPTQTILSR